MKISQTVLLSASIAIAMHIRTHTVNSQRSSPDSTVSNIPVAQMEYQPLHRNQANPFDQFGLSESEFSRNPFPSMLDTFNADIELKHYNSGENAKPPENVLGFRPAGSISSSDSSSRSFYDSEVNSKNSILEKVKDKFLPPNQRQSQARIEKIMERNGINAAPPPTINEISFAQPTSGSSSNSAVSSAPTPTKKTQSTLQKLTDKVKNMGASANRKPEFARSSGVLMMEISPIGWFPDWMKFAFALFHYVAYCAVVPKESREIKFGLGSAPPGTFFMGAPNGNQPNEGNGLGGNQNGGTIPISQNNANDFTVSSQVGKLSTKTSSSALGQPTITSAPRRPTLRKPNGKGISHVPTLRPKKSLLKPKNKDAWLTDTNAQKMALQAAEQEYEINGNNPEPDKPPMEIQVGGDSTKSDVTMDPILEGKEWHTSTGLESFATVFKSTNQFSNDIDDYFTAVEPPKTTIQKVKDAGLKLLNLRHKATVTQNAAESPIPTRLLILI